MNNKFEFSEQARISRRKLLHKTSNKIIYICFEDKNKEYLYEKIFEKIFPTNEISFQFYGLNGKKSIKKIFETNQNQSNEFFILDGDFDKLIYDDKVISHPNLLYLNSYNIENYIINEKACIELGRKILRKRKNEIQQLINFPEWKEKAITEFKKLFLCFCISQKKFPDKKTIKTVNKFIDSSSGFMINSNYTDFYTKLNESIDNLDNEITWLQTKYESIYGTNYFYFICGKCLIQSLFFYLLSHHININKNDLTWTLIDNLDPHPLNYLKVKIENFYHSINQI